MPSSHQFTDLKDFEVFAERQVGHDYNKQCAVEFGAISGFVGKPKRVLELGCGLGRMSIFMNWQLENEGVHFVLADANEVTNESNISGWNPGRDFYNSMDSTKEFCGRNGLTNMTLFDINRDDATKIEKVDLLYSFLAVGFHFPIEDGLRQFWPCLNPGATLIFGVRQSRYSVEDFTEYFEECYLVQSVIADYQKQTRKQHFLVLKGPKELGPPPTIKRLWHNTPYFGLLKKFKKR